MAIPDSAYRPIQEVLDEPATRAWFDKMRQPKPPPTVIEQIVIAMLSVVFFMAGWGVIIWTVLAMLGVV